MTQPTVKLADDHIEIRPQEGSVLVDNRPVSLTRKEFELLATLAANEGEIVHRTFLLQDIWGYGENVRTRTLDVHIRRLRRKLENYGDSYIETVFGVGYRFKKFPSPATFRSFVTAA